MGIDDTANRIDPTEFETWIRIGDGLKLLSKTWDYNTAQRAILKRVRLAQIKTAAEMAIWWKNGMAMDHRPHSRLAPLLWNASEVDLSADMWDTGDIDLDPNGSGEYVSLVDVRLHPADFQKLAPTSAKVHKPPQPEPQPSPAPVADPRPKGGRPRAGWWDDLWIEMIQRILDKKLNPASAAQLEGWMDDWVRKRGFSPGDSSLKPSALKLFKFLKDHRG